jgi:hypothetical protein
MSAADAMLSARMPTLASKSFFMTHLTAKLHEQTRKRRPPIAY